jgi:hypothetical protein
VNHLHQSMTYSTLISNYQDFLNVVHSMQWQLYFSYKPTYTNTNIFHTVLVIQCLMYEPTPTPCTPDLFQFKIWNLKFRWVESDMFRQASHHHQGHKTYQKKEGKHYSGCHK